MSHLHKALTQLNVQLQHVISDLGSHSGGGTRSENAGGAEGPAHQGQPRRDRQKPGGDWRAEHLFTLAQSHELWRKHQALIAACDEEIARLRTSWSWAAFAASLS